ncbi:unnamed protein product [Ceutorhynchus assimilis]|uniref:SWIM-type domain-containing protein n=1 Tax=Ceutorhynchus assimilis TaxID=467358 RepID=A0A9N9MEB9_9CUCU|nr:unnamed protein product [Ceutorhynchus assimilis]
MASINYYLSLATDVKCRYDEKIQFIDNVDPFKLSPSEFTLTGNELPEVSILDLSEYLTHAYSYYTNLQLKAYKGLSAFKCFEAGAVQSLLAKKINDFFVVLSKIRHSQKKPLDTVHTWVILLPDGSISSAHCTCMAGLAEVCSHVAIILFYLMSRLEEDASTSQLPLGPVLAVRKTEMSSVSDMKSSTSQSQVYKSKREDVQPMTQEETVKFLRDIMATGVTPAICRIMEPFASELANKSPE